MVLSVISSPIIPAIDSAANVTTIDGVTINVVTPNAAEVATSASVVALSAAAQILSTTAAATELANEEQSALVFQENVEQLATQAIAAQATLTQAATELQKSALTETETNMIDLALQSALADTALSEAVATTATAIASSSPATSLTIAPTTTQALNETIAVSELSSAILNTAVPTNASSVAPAIVANQSSIPLFAIVEATINPATSIIDPAVAAAIAAYRVGDGLFSEKGTLTDEIPAEPEMEVASISRVDGTTVDLHDSARDDALYGLTWNWTPVQPVQKRFTRR